MKYFVGGLMRALIAALVVLLIQHESRELRRTVKETVKESARESVDTAIERAPEAAGKAASRVVGSIVNPSRVPEEPAPPADSRPQSEPPASLDPVAVVGSVFETGRRIVKSADDVGQQILQLDDEQEREIGRELHAMIVRKHKCVDSPSIQRRIEGLAAPILALCQRKAIKYTFTIVDDPSVNAFSHLGGYIYVHKGLLEMARDDAELQFVLAHEVGHVDKKHCVRALTYAAHVSMWTHAAVGQLAQIAYHLIALGYSEDLEFEADEFAFRNLIRIGRSRQEALSFPRHFAKYVVEKGLETGHRKPTSAPAAVVQEIENHFRSHPPAEERLRRLESIKL